MSTEIHEAIALLLCNYAKVKYDDNVKDDIKIIIRNTKAEIDSILLAVNYIYKLVVANDHQLHWKPTTVFSTSLWIAIEVKDQIQIEIHKWHEKTSVSIRDLKSMEIIIKCSLGHQIYVSAQEFEMFKSEFLRHVKVY